MKNQPFLRRLGFAAAGLIAALRNEHSFRVHVVAAVVVLSALVALRPSPIWWAAAALAVGLVMAIELVNTAVEHLADHLHPEQHPQLKVVKDCLAGAVLVASVAAIAVAAAFLWDLVR